MTIGEKIKSYRKKLGITQEELAEKINVSRSAVAKWESDNGTPEIANLKIMCQIFEVSIDEMLDEEMTVDNAKNTSRKTVKETDMNMLECKMEAGYLYFIDLCGWNDGVNNVVVLGEDKNFLFYQRKEKKNDIMGMIGKKYITSISKVKKIESATDEVNINRDYFVNRRVLVEIAHKDGFIKGFFDFTNDDFMDVVIKEFDETKLVLEFNRQIDMDNITKIEERI